MSKASAFAVGRSLYTTRDFIREPKPTPPDESQETQQSLDTQSVADSTVGLLQPGHGGAGAGKASEKGGVSGLFKKIVQWHPNQNLRAAPGEAKGLDKESREAARKIPSVGYIGVADVGVGGC